MTNQCHSCTFVAKFKKNFNIFNCLSKYLRDYKLLNCNQSSFWPGDSCVHQLLLITYEIYKSFDANHLPEVRGVFLDIYKAFDRVWHDDLFFWICGRYYNLIQSLLDNTHQRVVLNGQLRKRSLVDALVPQGSISGLLLFIVYINDLRQGLRCNVKLFANDTSLFARTTSPAIISSNRNEDSLKIIQ